MNRSKIDDYNNLWWSIKENEYLDENTIVTALHSVEDLFTYEALFGKNVQLDTENIIRVLGSTDNDLLQANGTKVTEYKPDTMVNQSLNSMTSKINEIRQEARKINLPEKLEEQLRRIYETYGFEIADGSDNPYSKMWSNLCTIYKAKQLFHTNKLSNAILFFFRGNQKNINSLIDDSSSSLYKTNFYTYKLEEQNTIIKTELACKNDLASFTTKNQKKKDERNAKRRENRKKKKELQQKQTIDNERGYTDSGIITNPNYDTKSYNSTFGNTQKESYLVEDDNNKINIDNYISYILYNTLNNDQGINNSNAQFVNPNELPNRRIKIGSELFSNFSDKQTTNKYDNEEDEYSPEEVRHRTEVNKNKTKQKTVEQNLTDLKQLLKMNGFDISKLKDDSLLQDIVTKTTH